MRFKKRMAWKEPPTLESLVADWGKFVTEVEDGYDLTIYDYSNDLSIRDLLEELIQRVDREKVRRPIPLGGGAEFPGCLTRNSCLILEPEQIKEKRSEWQREKDTGGLGFLKCGDNHKRSRA